MAQVAQHRPVDAVLPDVQKAALPVGPARRPPGQLQGRPGPGHGAEEAVPQGGEVLQGEFGKGKWAFIFVLSLIYCCFKEKFKIHF